MSIKKKLLFFYAAAYQNVSHFVIKNCVPDVQTVVFIWQMVAIMAVGLILLLLTKLWAGT